MRTRASLVLLWFALAATLAGYARIEGQSSVYVLAGVLVVIGIVTAIGPGGDGDDNR